MKIISLALSAFGPYKEKITFDFTKFNDDGIFLITGPTGSGKTTILDGICFALYCRSTGGLRTFSQMRNLNASCDEQTQVCFEFSVGDVQYKFVRRLKVQKSNQDIKLKDEHECYVLNEKSYQLIDSGSERKVTLCAEKIIGLNLEQFSKVIVLPQGRFKELLLANSREKSRIFESLFKTEKWDKLCSFVQSCALESKKECDNLTLKQDMLLRREEVNSKDELVNKIRMLKDENEKVKDEILKTTKQKDTLYSTLETLKGICLARQEVSLRERNLNECKEKLHRLKKLFVDASSFEDVTNDIEEIAKLENKLSCLKKSKMIQSHYELKKESLCISSKKISGLKLEISDLQKKISQNTIAALAKGLEQGQPCPVCGSREHPDIPVFCDDVDCPTKEDVQFLEEKLVDEEKNMLRIQNEVSEILAQLKIICKNISSDDCEESISKILDQKKQHYNKNIKKIQIDLSTTKSKLDIAYADLNNAEKLFNDSKKKLQNLTHTLGDSEVMDIDVVRKKFQKLEERLSELLSFTGKFEEANKNASLALIELEKISDCLKDKTNEFSKTNRLFELLSGANKSKVPVKIFVLGVMLDRILSRANVYLASLSKYRYSLSRSDASSKRGYSGLDIEVFDAQLGGVRPAHTLSGGETFLASLSLAFGLSEVVQEYVGGIRLDSLFIDEGFDSLDLYTLDVVMSSFEKIKSKERLIGIISHVSELENYISKKINVSFD